MDAQFVSQTLFWSVTSVIGGLCAIVVGLISYIVRKNDEKIKEVWEDIEVIRGDFKDNKTFLEGQFSGMIKDFQRGINSLENVVSEMKLYNIEVKTEHNERIKSIEKKLEEQRCWLEADDKELNDQAIKIAQIKTQCEIQHSRRK